MVLNHLTGYHLLEKKSFFKNKNIKLNCFYMHMNYGSKSSNLLSNKKKIS